MVFDLGSRKDWWNMSPTCREHLRKVIPALDVKKNMDEVLKEGGVDLKTIKRAVWSHWHWDHTGDLSKFPKETELIVGPGFKKSFMPGYPANENSPMLDADYEGRTVTEISFSDPSTIKIGEFEAHDLYGDGSFYVLNVPGHAVGHISGLARTSTNPDTFVFMGGDVCHFGGSMRPTQYAPMPSSIPSATPLKRSRFKQTPCPCSLFTSCHPSYEKEGEEAARTKPYYNVTHKEGSWYVDPPTAQASIDKLESFDADPNVFVCLAHDEGLLPVVEWFPKGTISDWNSKGWKEASHWAFLNALPVETGGKPAEKWFSEGLMRDGEVARRDDLKGVIPSDWV